MFVHYCICSEINAHHAYAICPIENLVLNVQLYILEAKKICKIKCLNNRLLQQSDIIIIAVIIGIDLKRSRLMIDYTD